MGRIYDLFVSKYNYTDFHELNLDWLIAAIKQFEYEVENFVAINAVKYADPIQWDITRQYEKNTIVIDPNTGTAYISVKTVPSGVSLSRDEYWTVVFDLQRFVTKSNQNIADNYEIDPTNTATMATSKDSWVIWNDVLYRALHDIEIGDAYVVDANIERITVEDIIKAYMSDIEDKFYKIEDNITINNDKDNTNATFDSSTDDLLILNDRLYKVLSNITTGTTYVENVNISRISVEELLNILSQRIDDIHDVIGNLNDLSTHDKTSVVNAINDVLDTFNNIIGNLDDLHTEDKSSVVNAINAIEGDIQEIYTLIEGITSGLHITTPELYGAVGDGITDDTEAVQQAFDEGNYIILSNDYKITSTLFLDGDKTVVGGGTLHGWLPAEAAHEYLWILGATDLGVAGNVFTGSVDGVNIKAHTGNYNYCVSAINADNCQFKNMRFDFSEANCHNKMLYIGDNADVTPDNSTDKNYLVDNCYFLADSDYESNNNLCESVGVFRRSDIVISNCTTRYMKDDIGVHHSHFVEIRNNKMFDNFYARIYIGNCTDVKILSNEMVQDIHRWTQGIVIEWETTAVSSSIRPDTFIIDGNIVDFRNSLTEEIVFGIRVCGAIHGIISNNILMADNYRLGRIVIENQEPSGSLTEMLYAEGIEICNNKCSSVYHARNSGTVSHFIEGNYIHDNDCRDSYVSSSYYNISRGNIIRNPVDSNALQVTIDPERVPYNIEFLHTGTGSTTEKLMKINGFPSKRFSRKSKISAYYRMKLEDEITLTGANRYHFTIKKNGVAIREISLTGSEISSTNIVDNIFQPGDVLTVTFNYSGTAPTPQPSSILLQLYAYDFLDC